MEAYIYLENGTCLRAKAFGKGGSAFGEMVFNTSMSGYEEIITDPSYAGQFILFTAPEIGIVGINDDDMESSKIHASGVLMRKFNNFPSNFRSQKSLEEFLRIIKYIKEHISSSAKFDSFDTICRQVANRMPNIALFAAKHDLILFVSGRKSSNGKVLYNQCKNINPNSYHIENAEEIDLKWFENVNSVGICGATSTPKWLMEECRDYIKKHLEDQQESNE